jgi:Transglycosylase SLT domain
MQIDGPTRVRAAQDQPITRAIRAGCLAAALLIAVPAAALAGASGLPAVGDNPWTMCAKATNRVERQEGIPRQLLRAISKAESGRLHKAKQIVMAWPWTVMAEGRGRYLETKAEAVAEVEGLRARGVKNIDVGCMQVNLKYHPRAFASLEDAFDPLTNVRYAASFLTSLAAEQGSWAKAAAYYHSQNPERYRVYRSKVREIWATEREKYLLALEQLRAAHTAALTLASLIRVDAPVPLAAAMPPPAAAPRGYLPKGPILLRATATAPSAWPQPSPEDDAPATGMLVFNRAGPVRLQVVADLR